MIPLQSIYSLPFSVSLSQLGQLVRLLTLHRASINYKTSVLKYNGGRRLCIVKVLIFYDVCNVCENYLIISIVNMVHNDTVSHGVTASLPVPGSTPASLLSAGRNYTG